jgi:hypothetical protein
MRRLVCGVLFLLLWTASSPSQEPSPGESEGKTESAQADQQNRSNLQQSPIPFASWFGQPSPPIVNVYTGKHAGEKSECSQPEDWKEWASYSWCRGLEWINAERVIAIFTAILGMATWFLWRATRDLVRGAEETAERQLRAHVFIDGGSIQIITRDRRRVHPELPNPQMPLYIQVHTVIKNYGQTPAYKFKVWRKLGIRDPNNLEFGEIGEGTAEDILGPNTTSTITAAIPIDDKVLTSIRDGTKSIFSWGRISYIDAFKKQRHFTFYQTNGRELGAGAGGGWPLEPASKPYEEN